MNKPLYLGAYVISDLGKHLKLQDQHIPHDTAPHIRPRLLIAPSLSQLPYLTLHRPTTPNRTLPNPTDHITPPYVNT